MKIWWKKNQKKIIAAAVVLLVLAGSFFMDGRGPAEVPAAVPADAVETAAYGAEDGIPEVAENIKSEAAENMKSEAAGNIIPEAAGNAMPAETQEDSPVPAETQEDSPVPAAESEAGGEPAMIIDPGTGKDQYMTDPVPEGKPLPVEPQDVQLSETTHTCVFSISCNTILENMELCDEEKKELVPDDGWILIPTEVSFQEGESVFDVLQRLCRENKIHMEFANTPVYNSAYIEGIHNLYEFDAGALSGWMYKVNGWFPNYGCSRYQLKEGDEVCWVYTCDLGYDVGGGYATGE